MKIRERLKSERINKNLTQSGLANYLNISTNHYQAIENGRELGSIAIWDKLEDLFEIPQRQLRETSPSKNNLQENDTTKN